MLDASHIARILVEIVSTIICIILVRFMIKPYKLTRESRYIGLPLGFGFLAASYAIGALTWSETFFFGQLLWVQFMARTFSFVFLALTYYFSNRSSKGTRTLWNITFSVLVVVAIFLLLLVFITPQVATSAYRASQMYVRTFNLLCLGFIAIHTLRSHVREPDPTTIWIPMGFVLLAISQYSLLFWYIDSSLAAFWGAVAIRLMALTVFLLVAYRTFYGSEKGADE